MLDTKRLIEDLESEIILTNKIKLENPKIINYTYAQFILVGKISMLETLGYLSEEDASLILRWQKVDLPKKFVICIIVKEAMSI